MTENQTPADATPVALCPACAAEAGYDDDSHSAEPVHGASMACEHCAATLAGFFYVVPRDVYTGMAPGPG